MNMIKLNQQNEKPDFDELSRMIFELRDFLNQDPDFENQKWTENFNAIIDFQDDDGGFKLYGSMRIPSDARVDFIYMPTYICTAAIMKAFMTDCDAFSLKEKNALFRGLEFSCSRNLSGHGFEALKGQIEALNIFMKAGLREFIDIHSDFCPQFSEMMDNIISNYAQRVSEGNFTGPWNESYEDEIRQINDYFSKRNVFVYGTLMEGETNHHYLENSRYLCRTTLDGYDMYNVGWYPAITDGDGMIIGELYEVPFKDMPSIDRLEGEGSLYIKRCETLMDAQGKTLFAFVYVYLEDVDGLERIPSWKKYVWYATYGSNMLEERFMRYIRGGSYEGSTPRMPCDDTSAPLAVRAVEIPYDMYFGNVSGSWDGHGVSFLDTSKKGRALGVTYLISPEQFAHVAAQENGGTPPEKSFGWYTDIIDLEKIDGFEVKTITNTDIRPYNEPSMAYINTLMRGIRKNWPEMSDDEIRDYLENCIR